MADRYSDGVLGCLGIVAMTILLFPGACYVQRWIDERAADQRHDAGTNTHDELLSFARMVPPTKPEEVVVAYRKVVPIPPSDWPQFAVALLVVAHHNKDIALAVPQYREAFGMGVGGPDDWKIAAARCQEKADFLEKQVKYDENPITAVRTYDAILTYLKQSEEFLGQAGALGARIATSQKQRDLLDCKAQGMIRRGWATHEFQEHLYDLGLDIKVSTQGECGTVVMLKFPLWTDLTVHQFKKGDLKTQLSLHHFRQAKLVGFDDTWVVDL